MKKLIFLIVFLFTITCRPSFHSNFEVEKWKAYTEKFQLFNLADLNKKLIILNFYSPICKPCIDELFTLDLIYDKILANKNWTKNTSLYIALSSNLEQNGVDVPKKEININDSLKLIKEKFEKDKLKYKIKIPFIIMNEEFKIGKNQIITATPETLFLKTKPLLLDYNFIGPISNLSNEKEILENSRYKFVLSKIEDYQ